MNNPLSKRLLRELKSEVGKYLVIFVLLVATIGLISGFLVADNSLILAYEQSFEKYNIEDGNFRLTEPANKAQIQRIEEFGVKLYENFYREEQLTTNDSTLRIFADRQEINLVCLMEGRMPTADGEIAIDRMYAQNNSLSVGDTIDSKQYSWTITGLVALSDYSCLFSDNNDSMFDSVKFGVAIVSPHAFARFDTQLLKYCYSWKYNMSPVDEQEEQELSEEFMKAVNAEVKLETFVPQYVNQAICFTGEDMGGDKIMMIVLLYIIIAIMAFVFGVTTGNTIVKEANVIGTLRASGYTRAEMIRHYMAMPMLVTGISAVIGNILGYTIFKDYCAELYYSSYSLPTYVTVWNAEAFLLTTVVPVLLMIGINFFLLWHKLQLSPLKFLRRDLNRKKQKRAVLLSPKLPFFTRFRLRVIFQNAGNYGILFIGILFANFLLIFGMIFPSILDHYQQEMSNNLLCEYQYLLQVPMDAMDEEHKLQSMLSMLLFSRGVETEEESAEKFSAYSLEIYEEDGDGESVVLYGVQEDSQYIHAQMPKDGGVLISSAYAEKFRIQAGDTIDLKEKYDDKIYRFTVSGIYDYLGAIAVFMDQTMMNRTFDLGDEYFSGYFSDHEIVDIDEKYLSSVISLDDLTKISRQLDVSMGSMMNIVYVFSIAIFMVLVYLLSKTIIERNAQPISLTKILGYTNGEVSKLYILSTSLVVIVFLLISLPIETTLMKLVFQYVMMDMITGWIPFYIDPMIYIKMFLIGIITYAIVAALEYRKVRAVPMDEALKHVE